jgi:hypothetical protein
MQGQPRSRSFPAYPPVNGYVRGIALNHVAGEITSDSMDYADMSCGDL